MPECSFCENKAIKSDGKYHYCQKCIEEDVKFLLMNPEEREHLIELYKRKLEKTEELLNLEKRKRGIK